MSLPLVVVAAAAAAQLDPSSGAHAELKAAFMADVHGGWPYVAIVRDS